ncbi:Acetylcholinesterase [Dactylellina cionopaga]|nr:Acetylcholinesterase [Dactylellina cionopaga]
MRSVALHSGGGIDFQTNVSAQLAGSRFATAANCSTTDVSIFLTLKFKDNFCSQETNLLQGACLRRKTPQQLYQTFQGPNGGNIGGFTVVHSFLQPFVDGKVIPVQPSEAGVQVPATFTSTSQEGTFFVLGLSPDPMKVSETLVSIFLRTEFGPLVDEVLAQYPISAFEKGATPEFTRAAQIMTDYAFKCPAYRGLLKAAEKGIPAYTFIFDHQPTCPFTDAIPAEAWDILGATHGVDVGFLFANTVGLPKPNGTCSFNSEEMRTSDILVDAFTAFAATGNVSTDQFAWPTFTNESYQGLYIGPNSTEVTSLLANYSICEFWGQISELVVDASVEAANSNSTNVIAEIPSDPSITQTAIIPIKTQSSGAPSGTQTSGGPVPTRTEPSEGFRTLGVVGKVSLFMAAAVGYILMELI